MYIKKRKEESRHNRAHRGEDRQADRGITDREVQKDGFTKLRGTKQRSSGAKRRGQSSRGTQPNPKTYLESRRGEAKRGIDKGRKTTHRVFIADKMKIIERGA
jgi:hypothetical protein